MEVECLPHAFLMSLTRKGLAAALSQITLQIKMLEPQGLGVEWRVGSVSLWGPGSCVRRLSCWPP